MTATRGFTLLELVLVVAVMALVAGLIVPRVWGRTEQARRAGARADLEAIAQALELYRLDGGTYPTTGQGLGALVQAPVLPPAPRHWRAGGYLPAVPVDPWGAPYAYGCDDRGRFVLRSYGADHAPGGAGAAADVDRDAS